MSSVKKQLFEQLANIAQAISSPQRLELLDYLAQAERSVEELSQLTGLSLANTSRHLQVLKQNALVEVRKDGNKRLYLLAGDDVVNLISSLRKTAETHLAQVEFLLDSYLTQKDKLDPISADQLMEMSQNGEVIIVDVRPEKEYRQGHIPHAINIPPEDLGRRLNELDNSKTIVAYCRGPYCLFSYDAVEALQKKGVTAHRLVDGFPEWKAAGRPTTEKSQS